MSADVGRGTPNSTSDGHADSRWRRRRTLLGPSGIVVAAVLNGAAELTPKGRIHNFLWWSDLAVAPTLRVLGLAVGAVAAIAATATIERLRREANRVRDLERAADRAEVALLRETRTELRMLAEHLGLFSVGRASLFLRADEGFVLVGRYSAMSRYDRSSGRSFYDLESGILGAAFNRGEAERVDLPDPGTDPDPRPGWTSQQVRMGLSEESVRHMTMRSRSYAGLRLHASGRTLGVLIVESEKPQGASLASVKGATAAQVRLSRLLDHLNDMETSRLLKAVERCQADGRA